MTDYLEYLNVPTTIAIAIVGTFLVLQIIGEILEFKGKIVPEFLKIRKYFIRRKKEKRMLSDAIETLAEVKKILAEIEAHYGEDNIRMRDEWMMNVNKRLERNDDWIRELDKKLDRNNHTTLDLLVDSKRNTIIDFASMVANENTPVTREQFNRIFKLHEEYENIIESNGMTNGEVDIAFRIIEESYEEHTRNHSFIEDVRGYEG